MKNIIISLMIIAAVATLIGTGIAANFSDTESATGNTFTAGTLNLKVGALDPCTEAISVSNLKPGDTDTAATWLAKNTGTIAGDLTVAVGAITNDENTLYEVEADAGDVTENTGELGANLKIAFWMDVDKDNAWSSGDYYLKSNQSKVVWDDEDVGLPAAAYDIVNNYDSKTWTGVQNVAATTDAGKFRTEYDLPGATGNTVQSDGCEFNITFSLNQ